jgi:hypothetical protein
MQNKYLPIQIYLSTNCLISTMGQGTKRANHKNRRYKNLQTQLETFAQYGMKRKNATFQLSPMQDLAFLMFSAYRFGLELIGVDATPKDGPYVP